MSEPEYFCVEVHRIQKTKLYFKLESGQTLGATPNQYFLGCARALPDHEWKSCRNKTCYEIERAYKVTKEIAENNKVINYEIED